MIIEIKGNTATTFEKNTCIFYKKRLKSLKLYTKPQPQWSEQELTHPIHQHSDIDKLNGELGLIKDVVKNL